MEASSKSDRYLNNEECISRLFDEWKKYGSLIVAYDFDSTVFDYHKRGDTFPKVIELLRACKAEGFHLTVFTSCNDDRFPEIRKYLTDNNIPFDSINETPDFIPFKGRKVYFNILLDDRAGLWAAYDQLWKVIYNIRSRKQTQFIDDVA